MAALEIEDQGESRTGCERILADMNKPGNNHPFKPPGLAKCELLDGRQAVSPIPYKFQGHQGYEQTQNVSNKELKQGCYNLNSLAIPSDSMLGAIRSLIRRLFLGDASLEIRLSFKRL